ncbi:MAG: N-6 DNA methylase, partial [Planctomycetota bacterium]
ACSGLGINAKEEDWVKLAGADGRKQDLMRWLYSLCRNAPTLGSLIDPRRVGKPMVEDEIAALLPLLEQALSAKQSTDETRELAIAAQGLVAAARILKDEFTLVATNVPYLGRGKQDDVLKEHCETFHGDAKADLATCFVDRTLRACAPGGSVALVTPQNWLFLTSYKKLRQRLLKTDQWDVVARLGPHAFETITGEVVNVALLGLTRFAPSADHTFAGWDVAQAKTPMEKAAYVCQEHPSFTIQRAQRGNPDHRIVLGGTHVQKLLCAYAASYQGTTTGDNARYVANFWELPFISQEWEFFQGVVEGSLEYGGRELVLHWERGQGELARSTEARVQGQQAFGQTGVFIGQMQSLPATIYSGQFFNMNGAAVVPRQSDWLPAIWAFCSTGAFNEAVRRIDSKVNVTNATLVKVPFDFTYWESIAAEKYPNGLPRPHSDDPTQWLFNGHPKRPDHPLQVAVSRLVSYRWPRQTGSSFPDCPALGPDGLEPYADADGIVCLASVAGEDNAAARLRALLQTAYGADYNLGRLLEGKKSATLEGWLRDEFFEEHCQIFHQRPFVWHVWDGLKDGFHALVNYHKLDRKTLEKLIFSYLGDWLTRQRQDVANGVEGADARLAAAEHLQSELKKIFEGGSPFDIFVRWKPLKEQPIGWEPDLNDGVRVNIRPWITEARLYKATKPGILRITPNIKYTKDRGKEPARDPKEFPWFKGSMDRINDYHLSLEEKKRARGLL